MTYERLTVSENDLLFAFSSAERKHIMILVNKANSLLDNMKTKEDKIEYHERKREYQALKYVLKNIGALNKELLQKIT